MRNDFHTFYFLIKKTNITFFLQSVVDYYNSGTEDGYKKFVPSKKKKRDGKSGWGGEGNHTRIAAGSQMP